MNLLITGATGFIGRALCTEAAARGHAVRRAVRTPNGIADECVVGDIDALTDWHAALQNIDVVIHLAARVHVMQETVADPLAEFRKTNVAGTENLARQAAEAGVKRLVYVSSIKVNGEETANGHAFTETDPPAPQDPYGISKLEAEQALQRVAAKTSLEVVIVRPPLVYGPGVKANFLHLLSAAARGLPLPLRGVHNRRDLLYVGNLVDALLCCATHPAATGKIFLLRDGIPYSTPDLFRALAEALHRPARLLTVPAAWLRFAGHLTGHAARIERLLSSLEVDDARIRRKLNWQPPFTPQQGFQATADWYRQR